MFNVAVGRDIFPGVVGDYKSVSPIGLGKIDLHFVFAQWLGLVFGFLNFFFFIKIYTIFVLPFNTFN